MFRIAKSFNFSASHTIGGLPADHPCSRLHGHNYRIEVILAYPKLNNVGMVRDYRELSALRTFIDEKLDHRHLNDVFGHGTTTAEFLSAWLFDWCKARWPEVEKVRVSETPGTWAEYKPAENILSRSECLHILSETSFAENELLSRS